MKKIILILFLVNSVILKAQDSIAKVQVKGLFFLGSSVPIFGKLDPLPHGIDLAQRANITGTNLGIGFTLEYKEKFAIEITFRNSDLSYRNKRFYPKLKDRLTAEGLNYISLGGSSDEIQQKETSLLVNGFQFCGQYFLNSKKNREWIVIGGLLLAKPHFTSFNYSTRIPSTNYYNLYSVFSTKNSYQPFLTFGIEWRKVFVEKLSQGYMRRNHIALRCEYYYGKVNSNYEVWEENHLDNMEITNLQVQQRLQFLNVTFVFAPVTTKFKSEVK